MLERLPAAIANLKNLKSLLLHKNRLRTLPTEIIALKCLTEVCIVSVLAGVLIVSVLAGMTEFSRHSLIGSILLYVQFMCELSSTEQMGSFMY
jgi:hypothetical protein